MRVATGSGPGSAVYENRLYRCVVAGSTAAVGPVYGTTVGEQTTDGSAVFEAMEAWSRSGIVVDVIDSASFTAAIDEARSVDGWFAGGVLWMPSTHRSGQHLAEIVPPDILAALLFKKWHKICLASGRKPFGHAGLLDRKAADTRRDVYAL